MNRFSFFSWTVLFDFGEAPQTLDFASEVISRMWRNNNCRNSIAICSPCLDDRFRSPHRRRKTCLLRLFRLGSGGGASCRQETRQRSYADVDIIGSILMAKESAWKAPRADHVVRGQRGCSSAALRPCP